MKMKDKIRRKRVFWGIFLLAAAAFIIIGGMGCFGDVSGWTISFSILLIAWFIESLLKLRWGGMLFSLAFGAILFDEALGIESITPWPVLGAALLGSIGLNMIFKKKHEDHIFLGFNMDHDGKKRNSGSLSDIQVEEDEMFQCEVSFGSSVKYVNSKSLKIADLENAFGSLMVYFDNAEISEERAIAKIDNAFGKMTLFVPKEWVTRVEVTKSFGNITEIGRPTGESGKVFIIKGESAFGQLEIQYI